MRRISGLVISAAFVFVFLNSASSNAFIIHLLEVHPTVVWAKFEAFREGAVWQANVYEVDSEVEIITSAGQALQSHHSIYSPQTAWYK